jgi:hypothetical protein
MRIIIETDETQPASVVKTTTEKTTAKLPDAVATEVPIISGGSAPDDLLQTLGGPSMASQPDTFSTHESVEASADAMAGGPPPDWLIQAIESAHSPQSGNM